MREPITNTELAAPYDWCIAGGFAACPDKAGDCDVWVLIGVQQIESLSTVRERILRLLIARNIRFVEEQSDWSGVEGSYATGVNVGSIKVAKLADGRQIIVSNAASAAELLQGFDVSTHRVALTSDGELVRGEGFTPIDQPARALLQNSKTPERLAKCSKRYGQIAEAIGPNVPERFPAYFDKA